MLHQIYGIELSVRARDNVSLSLNMFHVLQSLFISLMPVLFSLSMNSKKRGMCSFDNNRFLLDDWIRTLAYWHKDITAKVEKIWEASRAGYRVR